MADTFAFTTNGICQRISARLRDDDSADDDSGWDKCLIQSSVLDILSTISIFRPDLFTKQVLIPLVPGKCGQVLPDECPRLSGYICIVSDNGDEIPIAIGDWRTNNQMGRYPQVRQLCKDQPDSRLLNITEFKLGVSPINSRRFNLSPTPPLGYGYTLVAECIELGDFTDNADQELPSEVRPWIAPIVELVLYMMLSMDSSDPNILARAQLHSSTFAQLSTLNLRGLQDVIQTLTNDSPQVSNNGN